METRFQLIHSVDPSIGRKSSSAVKMEIDSTFLSKQSSCTRLGKLKRQRLKYTHTNLTIISKLD